MIALEKLISINQCDGQSEKIAIIDGNKKISWAEFENNTKCLIRTFCNKGYKRVVFLSQNRYDLIQLFSAFSTLKIPFIGIDYTSSLDQKIHSIHVVEADAIFYSKEFEDDVRKIQKGYSIDAICLDSITLENYTNNLLVDASLTSTSFESIVFTSGTTGNPKAAFRTRSFDQKRFAYLNERYCFDQNDIFMATIPFYHASAIGWTRQFLGLGGQIIIAPIDDVSKMAEALCHYKVSALLVSPPVLQGLLDELENNEFQSVKFVISGGKRLSPNLRQKALNYFGPVVNEYYGTTETGVNVIADSKFMQSYPNSTGEIIDGSSIVAVDNCNCPLTEGSVGRIAISSYQAMDDYLGGVNAETICFENKRYILTADHGYVSEGRLNLRNRAYKDHSNIDIYAIEDTLRECQDVDDVFVASSSPDCLSVYIASTVGADLAKVDCNACLVAYQLTGISPTVTFIDFIPYGLSGKVRVNELKQITRQGSSISNLD